MNKLSSFLLLLLAGILSACSSAKVSMKPGFGDSSIQTVAMLPVEYNSGVQREKTDAIKAAIETELRNKGYVVLADKLVREFCDSPQCPRRSELADKYLVDAFAAVDVASVSRANFLAGYYNAVRGKLILSDKQSAELLTVERTESERGGLVFNTGQIFQGLISQAQNTEENSFARLSAKFAEELVAKVPKPRAIERNQDAGTINIASVETRRLEPFLYEVCAKATANSLLNLVIHRQRTNLRERSPGLYCGAFYLDSSLIQSSPIALEARSPFGDVVKRDIEPLKDLSVCNLDGKVLLSEEKGKKTIQVGCDLPGQRYMIYKGSSSIGPFQKVAEVRSTKWVDLKSRSDEKVYYNVIAVNSAGAWSIPENAAAPKAS